MYFQDIILKLNKFWADQGCVISQSLDLEVGAGTFHPATFLRSLGPEPWNSCYVQASRRPTDGRYGKNPNRLQHFYQYQVVMKPIPNNFQEIYLNSLKILGINSKVHDIRFVEDNWESPTLGANGLGWEIWLDGMEITQFTYFQKVASFNIEPIMGEITYGLERIAMYLQNINSVYDLIWQKTLYDEITYGDIFQDNEFEQSNYNFLYADINFLFNYFDNLTIQIDKLLEKELALPAYEQAIKASHTFNLLDARGAISITQRQQFILKIRNLTKNCAKVYLAKRKKLNFPLLKK